MSFVQLVDTKMTVSSVSDDIIILKQHFIVPDNLKIIESHCSAHTMQFETVNNKRVKSFISTRPQEPQFASAMCGVR